MIMSPLDLIALLALQQMNLTDTQENATVIVCQREECAARPASRQNEGNFKLHVSLRSGERLAAIVHTHPTSGVAWDRSGEFSPGDKQMADELRIPSYVYFVKLHQIRVYEPKIGERIVEQ